MKWLLVLYLISPGQTPDKQTFTVTSVSWASFAECDREGPEIVQGLGEMGYMFDTPKTYECVADKTPTWDARPFRPEG
ncbi:MAG: hypothetical protein ABI980_14600 [Nitrospirota bacterium]